MSSRLCKNSEGVIFALLLNGLEIAKIMGSTL